MPLRCFETEYGPLGSCKYDNLCEQPLFRMAYCFVDCFSLFGSATPNCDTCQTSTECTIPSFQQEEEDMEIYIDNFSDSEILPPFAQLFLNGLYNVKVKVSDIHGEIDCFTFKYSIVKN